MPISFIFHQVEQEVYPKYVTCLCLQLLDKLKTEVREDSNEFSLMLWDFKEKALFSKMVSCLLGWE